MQAGAEALPDDEHHEHGDAGLVRSSWGDVKKKLMKWNLRVITPFF